MYSSIFQIKQVIIAAAAIFCIPVLLVSQNGRDIAKLSYNRQEPADMTADLTMILKDSKGRTRNSSLHVISQSGGEKQIIWFLAPADDKGVSFLKIEHDDRDDEMRLWLPAFNKIRRISSKKKSDAFMGSDMSYEDMSNRELSENDYQLLKEEDNVNGINCYVLDTTPKKEVRSEYSHHKTWIARDGLYPVKEESYDRSGRLLKNKQFNFQKIDQYYVLTSLYVENIPKGHNTTLTFANIKLDTGITDSQFQEKNLKRIPRK